MATVRTKFTVGLFMLVGIAMVMVTVIWLGLSHYLEKGQLYAAYFDESVQGLDKDSPVKYRGVSIGRVHRIGVAPDGSLIQVTLKMESPLRLSDDLVAQLKSIGITGIMYVELEQRSAGQPDQSPPIDFQSEFPVIATRPSGIKQFVQDLNEVIAQFNEFDVKGISTKLKTLLDQASGTLQAAQVEKIAVDVRRLLTDLDQSLAPDKLEGVLTAVEQTGRALPPLVERIEKVAAGIESTFARMDSLLEANANQVKTAIEGANAAAQSADRFFKEADALAGDQRVQLAAVERELLGTLQGLQAAVEKLNRFIDLATDQPTRLFFRPPPEAREVPP